jgi:hypothetical protein
MPASEPGELTAYPRYLLIVPDGVLLRPGHLVAVPDPRAVMALGGSVPAWDRARRVIEGDDA